MIPRIFTFCMVVLRPTRLAMPVPRTGANRQSKVAGSTSVPAHVTGDASAIPIRDALNTLVSVSTRAPGVRATYGRGCTIRERNRGPRLA